MTRHDIAQYALDALKKAGADKAACRVTVGRTDELNVASGKFTLMRTLFGDELSLKAIKNGRKGTLMINKLDGASVDAAVAECMALTDAATPDDAEDIAEKGDNKAFASGIDKPDMDGLYDRSEEFLAHVRDEYPTVTMEEMCAFFKRFDMTYANSNGVCFDVSDGYYELSTMFSAREGDKASSFNGYGARFSSLDRPFIDAGMTRALIDEAGRSVHTRMVEGKYVGKVIVTPACADMILGALAQCFLSDYAIIQGTSRWKDALGTQVADKRFTVRSAPLHQDIVGGERVTADGYESADYDIIKDGVLKSFMLSLYGARKSGKARALNSGYSMEIAAGDTPLEDMIKSVDRGVLINRFSGGAPGPSGDMSGVAKNSFMIESGRVTDALSETMVSFNIADVLRNIAAISRERCLNGTDVLPWCCFDGVTVSGK